MVSFNDQLWHNRNKCKSENTQQRNRRHRDETSGYFKTKKYIIAKTNKQKHLCEWAWQLKSRKEETEEIMNLKMEWQKWPKWQRKNRMGKKNEQRASGTCGPMTKELHLCHEAPCLSIIFNLFNFGYLYIQALRAYSIRFIKPSTRLWTTLKHSVSKHKAWQRKNVILGLHFAKTHILLPSPKIFPEPNKSIMVRIIYSTQCNWSLLSTYKGPGPMDFHICFPFLAWIPFIWTMWQIPILSSSSVQI